MTNKENKIPPHNAIYNINQAPDKVANFKKLGITTDVIAESTPGAGVSVSDVLNALSTIIASGSVNVSGTLNAQGAAIFAGAVTWPTASVDFSGASSVAGIQATVITTANNATLTNSMSGSFILVTAADKVISLPSTAAGTTLTIAISAAALSSGTGLSISPAAADAIHGGGLSSADDKDLILDGATDAEGDSVTLVGDGIDGWYITAITGTWSKEA